MQFTAPYALIGDVTNLALHFHADHLADLRASGLTDETIRQAGVYSIRPRDIKLFFSARKGVVLVAARKDVVAVSTVEYEGP